jgi:ribosomal protein S18 acetylase RimI-like enzyme
MTGVVSVNVQQRVVGPGEDDHVGLAWQLKERIRREDGVLRQRRRFFENAYERSTVYLYVDRSTERLVGFAAVRRDGYILFLAVGDDYRGQGFGKRLVARVADDYGSVTCHARTTNQKALQFYKHLGFEVKRRIDSYYEDGGDAYYLKLGDNETIRERLAKLLGR